MIKNFQHIPFGSKLGKKLDNTYKHPVDILMSIVIHTRKRKKLDPISIKPSTYQRQ